MSGALQLKMHSSFYQLLAIWELLSTAIHLQAASLPRCAFQRQRQRLAHLGTDQPLFLEYGSTIFKNRTVSVWVRGGFQVAK
jgi:hypothetical protein